MSLLDEFTETFVFMEKTRVHDGEGGYTTTWKEGAQIKLAQRFNSSLQARIAENEGVKSVFTFMCPKNSTLDFHDVLKRVSDGQIFRITSNGGDSVTPPSSSLNLTAVTAEKWELTT